MFSCIAQPGNIYFVMGPITSYCKSTIFGHYKIWRLGNNVPIWHILIWRFSVHPAQTYFHKNAFRQQISSATCALQPESFLFIYVMLSCLLDVESSIFIASHHKHLSFLCCRYMFSITFFLILHFKLL